MSFGESYKEVESIASDTISPEGEGTSDTRKIFDSWEERNFGTPDIENVVFETVSDLPIGAQEALAQKYQSQSETYAETHIEPTSHRN